MAAPHSRGPLRDLARSLGVATGFRDGLGNEVEVGDDTLVRVCAALGAEIERPGDASDALRAGAARTQPVPPVTVAWDGKVDSTRYAAGRSSFDGTGSEPLPFGVHEIDVEVGGELVRSTVISAPTAAWSPPDVGERRWGLAVHLAALRSSRSRSVGDLTDLAALARSVGPAGASVLTVLPLLPTFNDIPAEPSPYSPVSRLFWSELVADVGVGAGSPVERIDVTAAAAEVAGALVGATIDAAAVDAELARYARFRGAQHRLGRDWRRWPESARRGELRDEHVDPENERFHLAAQLAVRGRFDELGRELGAAGVTLGLDLAVGVHPEGYDVWSRPNLFAGAMSVGAPPDAGFPSGQNWGFPPILPAASRAEGHRYLRATIAHQTAVAGLLRIDHVMALRRLYWIPEGMSLDQGTYVDYPMEELFALVCLESHLHRCQIVGENLGTVPAELDAALDRHGINGMRLVQFSMGDRPLAATAPDEVAFIGTHDTPTFAGWLTGADIDLRVDLGLLPPAAAPAARAARTLAVGHLVDEVGGDPADPADLLERVIVALGSSASPLVLLWLEDLWLEPDQVNVPGTSSAEHPDWQRPMGRLLDEVVADPEVGRLLAVLDRARSV